MASDRLLNKKLSEDLCRIGCRCRSTLHGMSMSKRTQQRYESFWHREGYQDVEAGRCAVKVLLQSTRSMH